MPRDLAISPLQLLNLLDAQLHAAAVLENLMMAEHSALLRKDASALTALVAEKHERAVKLENSSIALSDYTQGLPDDCVLQAGIHAIRKWQQLGVMASRLRQQSLANAALLHQRQHHMRWAVEQAGGGMLTGNLA